MFSAIVFLPLVAAIVAGLFGRLIGDRASQVVTSGAMLLSAGLAIIGFFTVAGSEPVTVSLFTWIDSGTLEAGWTLYFDSLTAVMVAVVTIVSAMVHVYSIGYMSHDKSIPRFMAYLSLFTFFMLTLVTSDNFVQLYFGWEGVGLCSYLLIGFWYDRPSANAAAIKAFVVNRVGDFGFALGIAGIFLVFDSISFAEVFARAPEVAGQSFSFLGAQWDTLTVLCLLLFVGAMGKSAQIGLHTWLPDAMEGPTPVSALIHAATMVTAGVFMVVRLSPVFEYAPVALTVVAVVGGVTAFFAATVALTQTDIKRVIAYSTCSQLGYMFFAVGVSAYPAAIFHLTTHAFFKALLFLGAGAVIHAIGDEQDMRNMGGLRHKMRVTWVLMWIGSLALAGIPFFAGFFSKDIILESAWAAGTQAGNFAFWAGIVAALLTAFYSWRLLYLTFHGHNRGDPEVYAHAHEAPPVMLMPLAVLAVGAVVAGALLAEPFVGDHWHDFWGNAIFIRDGNDALHDAHSVGIVIKLLPIAVAGIGIALATWFYATRSRAPAALARDFAPVHRFLLAKWYFDELYDLVFVRGANALGRVFWRRGDGGVIDRFGPDGVAWGSRLVALRAGLLQSGYVYHYAFAMLVGLVVLISWFLWLR